jgi:hypothetical protein
VTFYVLLIKNLSGWPGLLFLAFLLAPAATPAQPAPRFPTLPPFAPYTRVVHTKACVEDAPSCRLLRAKDGTVYSASFIGVPSPPVGAWISFTGTAYPDEVSICGGGMNLKVTRWKLLSKTCPKK